MSETDEGAVSIGVGEIRDYFKKWEYKIITADPFHKVIKINSKRPEQFVLMAADYLNELGDQGWEMVTAAYGKIDGSDEGLTFVMKRRKG